MKDDTFRHEIQMITKSLQSSTWFPHVINMAFLPVCFVLKIPFLFYTLMHSSYYYYFIY